MIKETKIEFYVPNGIHEGNYIKIRRTKYASFLGLFNFPVWFVTRIISTDSWQFAKIAMGYKICYDDCFPDGFKDSDVTSSVHRGYM